MRARADFVFFVRPRRFGKTLLCETLRCYYDIAEKENFGKLFGDLAIGKDPTALANKFLVLFLDFSRVNTCTGATWAEKFESYMDTQLDLFIDAHRPWLEKHAKVMASYLKPGADAKFSAAVAAAHEQHLGFYVIVDEYDNFTNEIVSSIGKLPYKEITHGTGFYRGWFKQFKLKTNLDAQHVSERRDGILPLTQELADSEEVTFNLVDSFPIEKVTDAANFMSLYYYYGIVTMSRVWRGSLYFRVANESVRCMIAEVTE